MWFHLVTHISKISCHLYRLYRIILGVPHEYFWSIRSHQWSYKVHRLLLSHTICPAQSFVGLYSSWTTTTNFALLSISAEATWTQRDTLQIWQSMGQWVQTNFSSTFVNGQHSIPHKNSDRIAARQGLFSVSSLACHSATQSWLCWSCLCCTPCFKNQGCNTIIAFYRAGLKNSKLSRGCHIAEFMTGCSQNILFGIFTLVEFKFWTHLVTCISKRGANYWKN